MSSGLIIYIFIILKSSNMDGNTDKNMYVYNFIFSFSILAIYADIFYGYLKDFVTKLIISDKELV